MVFCGTGGFEKVLLGFIALKQDQGDYLAYTQQFETNTKEEYHESKRWVCQYVHKSFLGKSKSHLWHICENKNCSKRSKALQTRSSFVYNLDEKLKS